MSRRESAADQERARKRDREEEAGGGGSPEGKKPKAEGGGAEEEARVAELRKKRQSKLKALQEAEAQKEQEAKKEAGAAVAGEGEGASARPSAQQRAGAAEDDEAYFDEAPPSAPQNGAAGGPLSEASIVEAMRGNGPLGQGGGGGGGASSSNGNGTAPHGSLNDSLEAYMTNLSAGAQLQQPSAARAGSRCVVLSGLITREGATDAQDAHMTRLETGNECAKWGELLRVHVPCSAGGDPDGLGGFGRVFVEFGTVEAAEMCARAMDGRYFDGQRVGAGYYDVDDFLAERLDEPSTPLEQNAISWEDIVAMNSRPASSWDSMEAMDTGGGAAAAGSSAPFATESDAESEPFDAAEEEGGEEAASRHHLEFLAAMRAHATETQRQQARAQQEVMEGGDDAMDALVEEFPDIDQAPAKGEAAADVDSEDEESSILVRQQQKKVLPPVDHSTIEYEAFRKNLYIEVPEIKRMTEPEVDALRKDPSGKGNDSITVRGKRCPRPIKRWSQCGLADRVLQVVAKEGYAAPYPIQAQALPAIMSGRDVIGIAKTGSGKTMGYTLPMIRHVMDQAPLANGDGPIGLVMVPTRELAMQVYREVRKFMVPVGLAVSVIFGGSNVKQQIAELKRCPEVVVCTPGRMIDMLTANSGRVTNLRRCTYVVMDEADRMFDLGFEPQISRIIGNVRPDRQTVLFSATFPNSVSKLARGILTKPVQIIVGGISVVSNMIDQHIEVLTVEAKQPRLLALLKQHFDDGQILVFVDMQESCDNLYKELLKQGLPCATLHGGMSQDDRDSTIADFRCGNTAVLVATSIAARGLDIKDLVCVINYEVPNHYEDYVHRVGRCGRAGNAGTAYTFITPEEEKYAPDLVKALEKAGQEPPDDVLCMANAYNAKRKAGELSTKDYRTSGFKSGKGIALDAESMAKEESKKRTGRKAAMRAAGVDGDADDDDDDADTVTAAGGASSSADATLNVAQAAADAAKKLQQQLGNKSGAGAVGADVQKKMLESAKNAAKEAKAGTSGAGTSAAAPAAPETLEERIATMAASNPRMASLPKAVQEAMAKAAMSSQEITAKAQADAMKAQQAALAAQSIQKPTRFTSDLEINEYPQAARFKVLQRDSLVAIQEWTKVAITTKGAYYPPGRNPPAGERKLYLLIEGETEAAVKTARKEMRRILEEQAAISAPDDSNTNRYAKYTV